MRKSEYWLDTYLRYTENSEPPTIYHKWVGIAVVASCLQRKCRFDWGTLTFYPNEYIILVGPPGNRKGTAMRFGEDLLTTPSLEIHLASEALTREQLIRELAESQTQFTTDNGKEIIHSSLTVYHDEIVVFLGYENFALVNDLTQWYDCKSLWSYRTKRSGSDIITGVWVNILGATTPDHIKTSIPPSVVGGGLFSRILFIFAGEKKATIPMPTLTAEQQALREDLLSDLHEIVTLNGQYHCTADFVGAWTTWYTESDQNPPFTDALLRGYCERRAAHVMKLSMILCAMRSNDLTLDAIDLQRSVELLEEAEAYMPFAINGIGKSPLAATTSDISAVIARERHVDLKVLFWAFHNDVTPKEFDDIIGLLVDVGYCKYTNNATCVDYNADFSTNMA